MLDVGSVIAAGWGIFCGEREKAMQQISCRACVGANKPEHRVTKIMRAPAPAYPPFVVRAREIWGE